MYQKTQTVPAHIFRAYDIRGVVEPQGLNETSVYNIGLAIGSEAQARGEKMMVIGRDGRLSSPGLGDALRQGLLDSGCDVTDIGIVPTPLVYFATHQLAANSGVMLTGSHNPGNYNGIKTVLQGKTLAENDIQQIYQRIIEADIAQGEGHLSFYDIIPEYIDTICQGLQLARRLNIVIDCGNGVAGKLAGKLYRQLGCKVTELFCEVDGHFPNHHPDPSRPENLEDLISKVHACKADIGLAFDGDADRLGVVTNAGEMIFPDRQVIVFAKDILSREPGADIVYDVKCSRYVAERIREWGGNPIMWKTGHSILKAKLVETGGPFAGEMSGHLFFKERWFGFDDGLYAGARLLEILANDERDSDQMFSEDAPKGVSTPEISVAMADDKKFAFIAQLIQQAEFPNANKITLDGLRVEYPDAWGLVRCSNTTPNLVLRFEANDEAGLQRIQQQFRDALLQLQPDLHLGF